MNDSFYPYDGIEILDNIERIIEGHYVEEPKPEPIKFSGDANLFCDYKNVISNIRLEIGGK